MPQYRRKLLKGLSRVVVERYGHLHHVDDVDDVGTTYKCIQCIIAGGCAAVSHGALPSQPAAERR